ASSAGWPAPTRIPAVPPSWDEIVADEGLMKAVMRSIRREEIERDDHAPWDYIRHHDVPEGFSHAEWWASLKFRRLNQRRYLPLEQKTSASFHYVLTDKMLRQCEEITRRASGSIQLPELATSQSDRDRYVVTSLIEEAITSSQLEGAATSRKVAKQMIRSGRRPATRGERMIANNYLAMQLIQDWRDEAMSPSRLLELHEVVTAGTLDDPGEAGRLQSPGEQRVAVYGDEEQILHVPPPAEELPSRLAAVCSFANAIDQVEGQYVPAPVRAIVLHFMMGYDHYFADGNGRTARALFYWCMLRNGYWLTEYVTISRILKHAPAKYARSFLLSEDDDGDLTHFIHEQLAVFLRALDELEDYLTRKSREIRELKAVVDRSYRDLNHRELAILDRAIRDDGAEFTVTSHSVSHRISPETARLDLLDLESRGLLTKARRGKRFVWTPVPGATAALASARG
ncbi:MAG: Fic family protein, partial [Pseudolysinimonas sp.]